MREKNVWKEHVRASFWWWSKGGRWSIMLLVLALMGCGLETLIIGLPTRTTHEPPTPEKITKLEGKASELGGADVTLRAGEAVVAQGKTESDGSFSLELPKGSDFSNLLLEVKKDTRLIWSIVPLIKKEVKNEAGTIDLKSTAAALVLIGKLSTQGLDLFNYPVEGLQKAIEKIKGQLDSEAALKTLLKVVTAVDKAAQTGSGSDAFFQVPSYQKNANDKEPPKAVKSGLNAVAYGSGLDYCAKGDDSTCKDGPETTAAPFDMILAKAIKAFALPTCQYKDTIKVIFTVTISPTAKDGNCSGVNQFKHAKRYKGTECKDCRVYLAAGIHKDSGIQDKKVSLALGDWAPNITQMYDDGTHGDLVQGDGIWTYSIDLPAPQATKKACKANVDCDTGQACISQKCHKVMRLGYKYTFGFNGDVWSGTEEFPGNQRLLEIVDQNGDGFVARHDVFADETANKDKVNTLQKKGVTGLVCFVTPPKSKCTGTNPLKFHPDCGCKEDQDGDGIPDVRERPWDKDNDCKPEGFKVFANVQPLTKSCSY